VDLVGDGLEVPCLDGQDRPYLNLDAAASTSALPEVARRVQEFLPWYSSVHRGAGYKSRYSTDAYEAARAASLGFAGREYGGDDIAIICRNTTEAINHLAYRLQFDPFDVVVTTVVEHHANLLPWARLGLRRFVECGTDGTFTVDDVIEVLDRSPRPRLLAITAASNVTGWMPPLDEILIAAHDRGIPVFVDAAQLAAHPPRPVRTSWHGAATRCMRRTARECWSDRGTPSPRATRSWQVAARSTWSTWTRWRGPIHPSGRRPVRPTS
jgi:selenocysteine lyase/cysteine desulfurase